MIGRAAITQRDDGELVDPRSDADWLDWVAARDVRNWCDDDLLLDCFERLQEDSDPARLSFRYVVALLLMRRKRLKFEEACTIEGQEILSLRCPGSGNTR